MDHEHLLNTFKEKFLGSDIYIIGKGPSLSFLGKEDIGDGVIITINEALNKIEELELSNFTFSMQKDATFRKPKNAALLVHKHEKSFYELEDYKPRYVFDNLEMGLEWFDFSALSAIKLGQIMGCKNFIFVSFDSMIGNFLSFLPHEWNETAARVSGLKNQLERMKPYLDQISYDFKYPKRT